MSGTDGERPPPGGAPDNLTLAAYAAPAFAFAIPTLPVLIFLPEIGRAHV